MAIIDILEMSDSGEVPDIGVGSVVIPKKGIQLLGQKSPFFERINYGFAVVVSMSPFILVSEKADMRWQNTVKAEDYIVVGKANQETITRCNTRLNA